MFQSFTATTRPEQGPPRLAALRAEMLEAEVDGFLVPRADAHQGEYVAARDERLPWLTGFTGSAGFCAVLPEIAGIFVDGRYRLQVKTQTDTDHFTPVDWPETKLEDWLIAELPGGGTIGYDPWLHTTAEITRLEKALALHQITLRPIDNLIDAIWADQPDRPDGAALAYSAELAGKTSGEKRAEIAALLQEAGEAAAVLTLPDSIAWLLNIRGADLVHLPVVQAFAVIDTAGHVTLFSEPTKLAGLGPDPDITLRDWSDFEADLATLSSPVRVDPATAPHQVRLVLDAASIEVSDGADPCLLPKARKTAAEIAATTQAHLRDGAAMARFLHWFDETAPDGGLTEIDCAKALEGFRADTGALKDISFDTISGAGPNGAIVHYRVTEETNAPLLPGQLFLIDSGAQYEDGTTDITRTLPVGEVGLEERTAFTQVLRGMIAIHLARFPKGLTGRDLDALARAPLWAAGRDYDHGTGHGVGVYLSVHEGPQRLSRASDVALQPGMILSNEPGYYREGAFGIRIENLVVVTEAETPQGGDAHREMFCFNTLTYVPIDRRLIDRDQLSPLELGWLNTYHKEVARRISPLLEGPVVEWLARATAPL
ncbi:M24 family metallopeptidase [Roseobacter sp. HKCCD9010]|uniref:aminopeptidase P family protein n=1 Tax=unclassified Roseobacter TaxID=196798 RepID=UPI0014930576|nr:MULTISPECIES: aminopeptidase P family protein [unclassified Roseobacter]MBF9049540.1 M24 family metallopeptidase [Rhodobacterales bacterium HKCCD4356]NNV11540.1 M24 family metallopeptidase [Roseobacter sp. HKCCD7357]NNV15724.1 M24 family metallopeptidase [Roseobacter sp. HKCCD8768]NNV25184.1 M24 family metallopeptidase [Roseobacter sp. HKCCD8192]NNV29441.1 M24 family metallopeptidase [Roseobacter sp. HKCCD9061]